MDIEAVKASYARWAPVYDFTFGAVTRRGRRRVARAVNQIGGEVLEVGVGTGLSLPFYANGLTVTGIDASAEMLEKARRRMSETRTCEVRALLQMDARNMAFDDASFDVVVATHVVSVVPEPERVVAEMARVCRPGGRVIITNHFARTKGVLAAIEGLMAPLDNLIGWHSDFEIERVMGEPSLSLVESRPFPPMGMMTHLVFEKSSG